MRQRRGEESQKSGSLKPSSIWNILILINGRIKRKMRVPDGLTQESHTGIKLTWNHVLEFTSCASPAPCHYTLSLLKWFHWCNCIKMCKGFTLDSSLDAQHCIFIIVFLSTRKMCSSLPEQSIQSGWGFFPPFSLNTPATYHRNKGMWLAWKANLGP